MTSTWKVGRLSVVSCNLFEGQGREKQASKASSFRGEAGKPSNGERGSRTGKPVRLSL